MPVPPLFLLVASLGLAALTLAWARGRLVGLCTLIVLTGWTNHTLRTVIFSPHDLRRILGEQADIVTVRAAVRETPTQRVYARGQQESWRTMARVEVTALRRNRRSWQPATGRMAVTTQGILSTNFFVGQEVEIMGVAGRPKIAAAEGLFDYRAFLSQQGIYYARHRYRGRRVRARGLQEISGRVPSRGDYRSSLQPCTNPSAALRFPDRRRRAIVSRSPGEARICGSLRGGIW
jgi:Domain of unknown function (DUF4131)